MNSPGKPGRGGRWIFRERRIGRAYRDTGRTGAHRQSKSAKGSPKVQQLCSLAPLRQTRTYTLNVAKAAARRSGYRGNVTSARVVPVRVLLLTRRRRGRRASAVFAGLSVTPCGYLIHDTVSFGLAWLPRSFVWIAGPRPPPPCRFGLGLSRSSSTPPPTTPVYRGRVARCYHVVGAVLWSLKNVRRYAHDCTLQVIGTMYVMCDWCSIFCCLYNVCKRRSCISRYVLLFTAVAYRGGGGYGFCLRINPPRNNPAYATDLQASVVRCIYIIIIWYYTCCYMNIIASLANRLFLYHNWTIIVFKNVLLPFYSVHDIIMI